MTNWTRWRRRCRAYWTWFRASRGHRQQLRTLGQLANLASYRPRTVSNPPCQDVVLQGEDVDLFKFPILQCWPMDGGRYITLPLVITRDPETGIQNYGIYRMQVYDRRTTGMHWQTHKVGAHHERIGRQLGLDRLDVAVALGGDPAPSGRGLPQCLPTLTR